MNLKLIVFFLLVLASYAIQRLQVKCNKQPIMSILHHMLGVYLLFGTFIFNSHYAIHLMSLLAIRCGWMIMDIIHGDELCIVTTWFNDACGYPKTQLFHDLSLFIDEKLKINISIFTILYDLYFISKGFI